MRAVNLLPRDDVVKSFEAKRGVAFGAAGGAALVTVLLATAMMSAGGAATEQQGLLDSVTAELLAVPKPEADPGVTNEVLAADKAARIAALSSALGGRIAWDRVLRQISQVLPTDVWLTSLAGTGSAAAGPTAPTAQPARVTLTGSTYSHDGVARVLARLSVIPVLDNVTLTSSMAQPVGARQTVQFSIVADLRQAGVAS